MKFSIGVRFWRILQARLRPLTRMAEPGVAPGSDTFLYFGYGSNLLRERLTLKNPSAIFKTIAKLEGYELGFDCSSPDAYWHGAAATITENPNDNCWGCVWTMSTQDVSSLDEHGAGYVFHRHFLTGYSVVFDYRSSRWHGALATLENLDTLSILGYNDNTSNGACWGCVWELRTSDLSSLNIQEGVSHGVYKPIEVEVETPEGGKLTCRTYYLLIRDSEDKRPSPQYMGVIIKGAEENELPKDYISRLKAIEHNGYSGEVSVLKEMEQKRQGQNSDKK